MAISGCELLCGRTFAVGRKADEGSKFLAYLRKISLIVRTDSELL